MVQVYNGEIWHLLSKNLSNTSRLKSYTKASREEVVRG